MDRELLGSEHRYVAVSLINLAALLNRSGRHAEAEALFREALRVQRKTFPEGHWEIANATSLLGSCLAAARRFDEAEPLLLGAYPVLESRFGAQHRRTRAALERIVSLYEASGRTQKRRRVPPPPRCDFSRPAALSFGTVGHETDRSGSNRLLRA